MCLLNQQEAFLYTQRKLLYVVADNFSGTLGFEHVN